MITSTGAKFWLRFCLSVLVLVIFKSPTPGQLTRKTSAFFSVNAKAEPETFCKQTSRHKEQNGFSTNTFV